MMDDGFTEIPEPMVPLRLFAKVCRDNAVLSRELQLWRPTLEVADGPERLEVKLGFERAVIAGRPEAAAYVAKAASVRLRTELEKIAGVKDRPRIIVPSVMGAMPRR